MKFTNLTAFTCAQMMENMRETGKLGYAIAKNLRKLNDELVEYKKTRDDLIIKYGEESDGRYIIPSDKTQDFINEMQEYSDIEFEYSPVLVSEDVFCSGGLTSDQMYELDWMVEETE